MPQHDHIVEIGFNWFPSDWFMFNACVGIEKGYNHSQPAYGRDPRRTLNFDEENYPMTFSVWYAVSDRLSLSAGYAIYSNFVARTSSLATTRLPTRPAHITDRSPRGGTTAGRPTS